jgi:hypothetical protein
MARRKRDNTGEQNQQNPLLNIPDLADVPQPDIMYPFNGEWLPSVDPALIGPENYSSLVNMRYNDAGLEGVTGYTYVNELELSIYTTIKNGLYFKAAGRTQEDYTLVHAVDPDTGQGRIYQNQTAIGSTGNFEATHLHADASVNLEGRFSKAPGGAIAYCNGEEVLVWNGEESPIASVFTTTSSAEANPVDVTEKLINSRTDSSNIVDIGTSRDYMTIMTLRPVQGFKFYVKTPNASASSLTVSYWNGSAYAAVSSLVDNTDTGPALAQTGTVTFTSTVTTAKLKHFQGRYLYAYQIYLDAGNAEISEITCDYPIQAPTNIWDGIYRTAIQCQLYTATDTSWEDYTVHVSESSTTGVPVGAILDGMVQTNDQLVVMFDEQMAGIQITMLAELVNTAGTTLVAKYWDGSGTWQSLTISDGTSGFNQSGLISWTPPSDEVKVTQFNTQGYGYQITIATADIIGGGDGKATEDVVVDLVAGVPHQKPINTFKFPVQYKNKLFLCNYAEGNEGNRIDYSADNSVDIFNGENSSLDGYQSIYVGGSEHLTCAAQLYNRFGSNLFTSLALFKNNELYLLTGDGPIDYKLFPVSFKIGCPAPLTLTTAEVGFELGEDIARNVAIFVSNSGPMMYDGAVLYPIRGIEKYFDPNESISVNFDYLDISRGWFDSNYKEYNMLIPTGTSTTLNTWLCYDLVRKKWFQKNVGEGDNIQCGFNVSASNGDQYIYGGTLVGKIVQLENGSSWGGERITNEITLGELFPTKNHWDITRIRRFKFVGKRVSETDAYAEFFHYLDSIVSTDVVFTSTKAVDTDSNDDGVFFIDIDSAAKSYNNNYLGVFWTSGQGERLDISKEIPNRLVREIIPINKVGWSHTFKFTFSSSETTKGLQPIMWGVQYELVRKDHYNL